MSGANGQATSGPSWAARLSAWVSRPLPWIIVLVLGLAARFRQYVGDPSYWYDETALTVSVYDRSCLQLLGPLPTRNIIPPFFLWVLRGCYLAFGPQEWSMRLPAFLAGVAAVVLMVLLARRWLAGPGWCWAVGFCALSTHAINHTVEVRPYAVDLLATVAILWAGCGYLKAVTARERASYGTGLLLAAALAPWLSFTSAFVLAAVSLALLVHHLREPGRGRWLLWLGLNGLLLLTSLLVWLIQARHLYYPGLKEEWTHVWGGFPPDDSPWTVLAWTAEVLERAAHYATTGLGVPLLLLAMVGAVRCWRRSSAEALLIAGPVAVTYLASLAGKYPFADRAILFLAPCVWLLAVEGLCHLSRRLRGSAAVAVPLLVVGLMAPGLVKTVKLCARVEPMMEYREALVFVHEHRAEEEAVWAWCPELCSVYADRLFRWPKASAVHDLAELAGAGRVLLAHPFWVICAEGHVEEAVRPLRCLPVRETLCRQFVSVRVLRFDRAR